jgi:hypothetical protein
MDRRACKTENNESENQVTHLTIACLLLLFAASLRLS